MIQVSLEGFPLNSVIDDTDRAGLDQVAARSLEKCMGARPGEQIGIVFDEKRRDIAEAFFRAGDFLGCETVAVEMVERERSGEEPPTVGVGSLWRPAMWSWR